jgi:hypothetical protein
MKLRFLSAAIVCLFCAIASSISPSVGAVWGSPAALHLNIQEVDAELQEAELQDPELQDPELESANTKNVDGEAPESQTENSQAVASDEPALDPTAFADPIINGDFETTTSTAGEARSWGGKLLKYDAESAHEGKHSGLLDTREMSLETSPFSTITQTIDPATVLGKRIRFSAFVKTADRNENSRAMLWLRVDRESGKRGAFDNMQNRPIECDEWEKFEIVVEVAEDAKQIMLGLLVSGNTRAWIDDATIEVVGDDVAVTDMLIDRSPKSAILTPWMWLALLVLAIFGLSQMENNLIQRFALRFSIVYWFLYSFSDLVVGALSNCAASLKFIGLEEEFSSQMMMKIYQTVRAWTTNLVQWTAETAFGYENKLPLPGGSGDTTYSWIRIFDFVLIALLVATVWSLIDRRKKDSAWNREWLRCWLRYTLAVSLLGYGLAKMGFIRTQFAMGGGPSEFQLVRTYGESSPMGLLWTFMAASPMYTFFAGVMEVVPAVLLIFRRTMTLGAILAVAVMGNVFMLNMCYDVPVKQYSFHLLIMGVVLLLPELKRAMNGLFWNRVTEPSELAKAPFEFSRKLTWCHRVLKTVLLLLVFGLPIAQHVYKEVSHQHEQAEDSEHQLINRGFRWVSEQPYNR